MKAPNESTLLDFSDYVLGKTVSTRKSRRVLINREHGDSPAVKARDFPEKCPFCSIQLSKNRIVDKMRKGVTSQFRERGGTCDVRFCTLCSWWAIDAIDITLDIKCNGNDRAIEMSAQALLKRLDWSSKTIPMEVLRKHLAQCPESLYTIHTKKMEELVQSVFREHFDCDVIHCGRSGDGGIDLLLIDGGDPTAVQVKRHEQADFTEPVEEVREFLGAMLLKGYKNGIFVSTAKRFSSHAIGAAKCAVDIGLASRFELFDVGHFFDIFNLRQKKPQEPWADCVRNHFEFVTKRCGPESEVEYSDAELRERRRISERKARRLLNGFLGSPPSASAPLE